MVKEVRSSLLRGMARKKEREGRKGRREGGREKGREGGVQWCKISLAFSPLKRKSLLDYWSSLDKRL